MVAHYSGVHSNFKTEDKTFSLTVFISALLIVKRLY